MLPTIFKIGPMEIRSYGLMLMLAFVMGIYLLIQEGKREEIEKGKIFDFGFYIITISLIFSRIVFVLLNLSEYLKDPFSILWPIAGLSFHGGLAGGILVGIYFAKKNKIPFFKLADIASLSLAVGLAIGRLGCFLNGCCAGHSSNLPWAVKFKDIEYFAHPSQIYDSLLNLFLFIFLLSMKKYKRYDGYIFFLYLLGSAISRFFVEFTRSGASARILFLNLTEGQVFCVVLFMFSVMMLMKAQKSSP